MNPKKTIPYDQIRFTAPRSSRKKCRPARQLRSWQGLLYFAAVMIILLICGGSLYKQSGSIVLETAAEQVFFLISAILFVRITGADRREVFPFRRPVKLAVAGILVLMVVCLFAAEVYSMLVLFFAPDSLKQMADGMNNLFQMPSLPMEILIACAAPAVCEEALHRGVILNSLRNSIPDRKFCILISGLLFGLFHLYPIRMIIPAFIGCLMCWVVLVTDNMFYSCLLHFGYNGLLVLLSRAAPSTVPETIPDYTVPVQVAGISLIMFGILIPFLLYLGTWMIRRAVSPRIPDFIPKEHSLRVFLLILLPTAAVLVIGVCMIFSPFL